MVMITSSKGIEADVSLDFDTVCDYEATHENWSIFVEIKQYTKTLRFTCLANLLALTTYKGTWQEWTGRDGFTTDDLFTVINKGLETLGFSQEDKESSE